MLNLDEAALKKAIIENAAGQLLNESDDLAGMVRQDVKARIDKIFVEKAATQIQESIDNAVKTGFDLEYQRVDSWGQPEGEKTTIRKQLEAAISGYWTATVNSKSGKPDNSYGEKTTRAEWLMTQICAEKFSEQMRQQAINVTAHLKDGLRGEMAKAMDGILNELFHVKSLQDQGKVAKPY